MSEFYKLRNKARHYDWGSPVDIPRLLGIAPDGKPWAELWMGSHSGFSSMVILESSGEISLEDLLARDGYCTLPFLLKLLAAEKPLSIQAHPNQEQAREGFERENQAGVPLDSPMRNYKDSNHKPEIICALSPFTGLCGFRGLDEIRDLFAAFLEPAPVVLREGFAPLTRALSSRDPAVALRDFLAGLFGLSEATRATLGEYIISLKEPPPDCELKLMQNLARLYPGDPAIIAPLYLNIFRLEPGEAVFLEAGVLHAYIHGFGVELMANSDNVLRGGLTPKHVDVPELIKILDFKPYKPQIITPSEGLFNYPTPCREFSLSRICGRDGAAGGVDIWLLAPGGLTGGPAICIVTEGELIISNKGRETVVKQGESLFILPSKNDESPLSLRGNFTLFIASCGLLPHSSFPSSSASSASSAPLRDEIQNGVT